MLVFHPGRMEERKCPLESGGGEVTGKIEVETCPGEFTRRFRLADETQARTALSREVRTLTSPKVGLIPDPHPSKGFPSLSHARNTLDTGGTTYASQLQTSIQSDSQKPTAYWYLPAAIRGIRILDSFLESIFFGVKPSIIRLLTSCNEIIILRKSSCARQNVVNATRRSAGNSSFCQAHMRFSLDTYFNSSPIHNLFDLFVKIL